MLTIAVIGAPKKLPLKLLCQSSEFNIITNDSIKLQDNIIFDLAQQKGEELCKSNQGKN